ncbi:hypothetical protein SAMN05421544_11637 [Riemerella columbipharyngis]|uniref:Uncharacterized protein n=1 Tax=Riemerella columbipharyngis TaxID=1071918 RepID=A0A1G7EL22_9FLAO|nr:hypothetical protein SAMN05421544_11637 [Riemerella columbipharyngis]
MMALGCFFLREAKMLKIEEKYTLVNENRDKIPVTIYSIYMRGDEKGNIYKILIFLIKNLKWDAVSLLLFLNIR